MESLDTEFIADEDNEIILHLADNGLRGAYPGRLGSIKNLYIDIVGNQFDMVPNSFCGSSQALWMNGEVARGGCDAIACPKDHFSDTGRASVGIPCVPCAEFAVAPHVGSIRCNHVDMEVKALKQLFTATNGQEWDEREHWMDITTPVCSWYGITCLGDSLDNGTITEINLPE